MQEVVTSSPETEAAKANHRDLSQLLGAECGLA